MRVIGLIVLSHHYHGDSILYINLYYCSSADQKVAYISLYVSLFWLLFLLVSLATMFLPRVSVIAV